MNKKIMKNGGSITLVAALIALLGSVLSLFISTRLAVQKERRQLLWSKELDRFFALEELSGELVELMGSYKAVPEDTTSLTERLDSLERAAGRFGRYPDVRQAIRDLHNNLGRLLAANRASEDDEQIRIELKVAFQDLLSACDKVIQRVGSDIVSIKAK